MQALNQNRQFANLLLITALLFGLIIRLAAPLNAQGPVNDGGLFFQMTRDLQANHFALPAYTTYNHIPIPFAYPPLGFYLTGLIQGLTDISLITLFTYLPAILSALAILAFYFLAHQLLQDNLKASLAALFYALLPRSFDWSIMGGGITRAPAIVLSFLTLAFSYRLLTRKQSKYILPAAICASLLALTHPEITFQTAFSVLILVFFFLRDWKSIFHSITVIALTLTLTSTWWFTVLTRHGPEPFQAALLAHPRDLGLSLLYLFQFNLSGENILTPIAILSLIGLVLDFRRRDFFLPAWIGLSFIGDPRAAPFASLTPMILLAVKGFEAVLTGLGLPAQFGNGFRSRTARNILLGLVAYVFMSGLIASMWLGNEFRILSEEREALNWITQNTPKDSRFLLLTGDAALSDPLSEWFPALTGRISIVTVQGHEWTLVSNLILSMRDYNAAQDCLKRDVSCIANRNFDYLYIRRVRPQREGNIERQVSLLEESLQESSQYSVVYDSPEAIIFARGKPTSNAIGPAINNHMAVWSP